MSLPTRMIRKLKYSNLLRKYPMLRKSLRMVGIGIAHNVCKNGVVKSIGGAETFLLSPQFIFTDTLNERNNSGFRKLLKLAKDRKVVFDIGAHIGLYTLPISKVLDGHGTLYAFEPSETNLLYLRTHLDLNLIRNVVIVPFLVGKECVTEVGFYEAAVESSMNSICDYGNFKGNKVKFSKVRKKQISIDSFVEECKCVPELIKIDVEGSEIDVLAGAKNILKKYHPDIILSVHPGHLKLMGRSTDELIEVASEVGYQFYEIDESPLLPNRLRPREYYLK